jgi:hypothetical protein
MGRTTAKAKAALTPREQALEDAKLLTGLKKEADALDKRINEVATRLEAYYKKTGELDYEVLTVSLRKGSAKLVGLQGKAFDLAKQQLVKELPDTYVKHSLDMGNIEAMHRTDNELIGALAKYQLRVEVSADSVVFRENK